MRARQAAPLQTQTEGGGRAYTRRSETRKPMRTSQAARYARHAAFAAVLLAGIVAGVYSFRAWQARLAERKAPPAVPSTVQQRSAGFSFSKVDQGRTLFTVRASRATEFKEGSRNLLEDVWITIYGS